jgi:succinate dehydrogenase flavin-adding protein (antitoxin of CptAB toxin-antitoxin module)
MSDPEELELLSRRAVTLSHRSLLELEIVIMEALRKELPRRVEERDMDWVKELVRVLELDDFLLLDAIMGTSPLGADYDEEVMTILQSYLPGRINNK